VNDSAPSLRSKKAESRRWVTSSSPPSAPPSRTSSPPSLRHRSPSRGRRRNAGKRRTLRRRPRRRRSTRRRIGRATQRCDSRSICWSSARIRSCGIPAATVEWSRHCITSRHPGSLVRRRPSLGRSSDRMYAPKRAQRRQRSLTVAHHRVVRSRAKPAAFRRSAATSSDWSWMNVLTGLVLSGPVGTLVIAMRCLCPATVNAALLDSPVGEGLSNERL
jgi:hypothetical protein